MPEPITMKMTAISLGLVTVTAMTEAWRWLVAQASPGSVADFVPDVANVGCLGAVIWFFYYTTSTQIPKLLADAKTEREQSRSEFLAALASERTQYQEFLRQHREDVACLSESIQSLTSVINGRERR